MRGEGKCPFTGKSCDKGKGRVWAGVFIEKPCELWDEYDQNCSINIISINLRKIEGARKE